MSDGYQHLGSDKNFSEERFQLVNDPLMKMWSVWDSVGEEVYYFDTKEKARERARAWNYEWNELSLNQFREGC